MIEIVNLHETLNPINQAERVKINQNWNMIESGFSKQQLQINTNKTNAEAAVQNANDAKRVADGIDGKVNQAISTSATAETKSDNAIEIANGAKSTAENVREQFNQVIAEAGSNNPEVVASRIDTETGESFVNLSQRLDQQHKQVTTQLDQTGEQIEYIGVNANIFPSLQAAIDYCIANDKALNLTGMTFDLSDGVVIDSPIKIAGDMSTTVLNFSAMTSGTAITIGDNVSINGLSLDGARIIGNTNIDALIINKSNDILKPVTDSTFKNLRIEGFKTGIIGRASWGLIFENVRCQNCTRDLDLSNQFNLVEFIKCSFVSTYTFATLNNCEGLHFNSCEFANLLGNEYGIASFQSWFTITNPYVELVPKFLRLGTPSESTPSSCDIRGGILTGRINVAKNKALLAINGSRANYADFEVNAGLDDGGAVFLSDLSVKAITNFNTKWLSFWHGNKTIPFVDAFGGGLTKTQLSDSMQLSHSYSNQGIRISSSLEIDKQYTLVLAVQKSTEVGVSINGLGANAITSYVKDYDGNFELMYMPFVATSPNLTLTWGSGSLYSRFIGLAEGVEVPKVDIKSEVILYGTSAPTSGNWTRGTRIYYEAPSASGAEGVICTVSGTPGTWKTFGTIGA